MAKMIDRSSQTWLDVTKWAQAEIEAARSRNDSLKLDHDKTTAIRSRIKTLKEIFVLPDILEGNIRPNNEQGTP